jgi:hypothetical protein
MDTLLAPAAPNLWPNVSPVSSYRRTGGNMTLEVPGLSESVLLEALSRAIHLEMRAAGEWADTGLPGPKDLSRYRTENAARLLAIYTSFYGSANGARSLDLSPEALKTSASRSYEKAFRDERTQCQRPDKPVFPPPSSATKPKKK